MERSFDETAGGAKVPSADGGSELVSEAEVTHGPPESTVEASQESTASVTEESAPPEPSGLEEAVAGLDARLEESQRLLARQSDLVDRLHAENQDLRAGELRNAQLPLVRDLVRLHDDVGRMRDTVGEHDDDLRVVQESLLDILARNGVEAYAPEHGEEFDPRMHAAAGTEPTADESLDKSVVEIVRRGFRWDSGDVIRVAEVRAYRFRDVA
jgi:molecular chaperone GrpE (heat shock protein)